MTSTYSTTGLDLEQRRVLADLPETVRADWVYLCTHNHVIYVETPPFGGKPEWLVYAGPDEGSRAPSPLELIEVTR